MAKRMVLGAISGTKYSTIKDNLNKIRYMDMENI